VQKNVGKHNLFCCYPERVFEILYKPPGIGDTNLSSFSSLFKAEDKEKNVIEKREQKEAEATTKRNQKPPQPLPIINNSNHLFFGWIVMIGRPSESIMWTK
jgi:hypothetical protein